MSDLSVWVILLALYQTNATSLNILKENFQLIPNQQTKRDQGTAFEHHLINDILEKRSYYDQEFDSELTLKELTKQPCVGLALLASKMEHFTIIATERTIHLALQIQNCSSTLASSQIDPSLQVIKNDEFDVLFLKRALIFSLATIEKRFLLLCSSICSDLILFLANELGAASSMFEWTTLNHVIKQDYIYQPENVRVLTVKAKPLRKRQQQESDRILQGDILKSNVDGDDNADPKNPNKVNSYDFQLRTASGYWFTADSQNDKEMIIQGVFTPPLFVPSTQKKILRVVTHFGNDDTSRIDMLDFSHLTCRVGLLCWLFPTRNKTKADERKPTCCNGLVFDILTLLQEDLDVTFHIYEVADRNYGALVNGSWNGLIGDLVYSKADLAADVLTVNEVRSKAVEFTDGYLEVKVGIASISKRIHLPYLNFETFAAKSNYSWLAIMLLIITVSLIICIFETLASLDYSKFQFTDSITYIFGILCQRDIGGKLPQHLSSRTLSVCVAICMLVIATAYTAVLTARNIINRNELPINGFDDPILVKKSFKYGTLAHSSLSTLFEESEKSDWKSRSKLMQTYNFFNEDDGFEYLREGKLQAIIINTWMLMTWQKSHQACDIQFAGRFIHTENFGFALPKGSLWREPMSTQIRIYKENGVMRRLKNKWLPYKCKNIAEAEAKQFDLVYLSGACITLIMGIFLSFLIFITEFIVNKFRCHR